MAPRVLFKADTQDFEQALLLFCEEISPHLALIAGWSDFLSNWFFHHFPVFPNDEWKVPRAMFFNDIFCGTAHGAFGAADKLRDIRVGALFRQIAFHGLVTDRTNSMSFPLEIAIRLGGIERLSQTAQRSARGR